MIRKIFISLILIMILPTMLFAGQSAYKVNSNYVAVRNDVFNKLTANQKMIAMYEKQIETMQNGLNDLEQLSKQKTEAYEKKIQSLQLTIEAKDSIIALKDDNIQQYKNMELLYNSSKSEIRKMKRMNVWEKVFIAGLATAACLTTNDTGAQIGMGCAGLLGTLINW